MAFGYDEWYDMMVLYGFIFMYINLYLHMINLCGFDMGFCWETI